MSTTSGGRASHVVAFRRVQYERVADRSALTVFCPRRNQVTDVAECRGCEHWRGLCIDPGDREAFVRCAWLHDHAAPRASNSGHAALSDIMSAPVHCLLHCGPTSAAPPL
jgi:hypothetical protein